LLMTDWISKAEKKNYRGLQYLDLKRNLSQKSLA
jgi:hypothetical protein